jgi:hypothetical protein
VSLGYGWTFKFGDVGVSGAVTSWNGGWTSELRFIDDRTEIRIDPSWARVRSMGGSSTGSGRSSDGCGG